MINVRVIAILINDSLLDISKQRCLILGTDGVWNVISPEMAVNTVRNAEKNNERHMLEGTEGSKTAWLNPSKQLVDQGVERWRVCKLRADNTSVVVVMLDPPGPPRAQVLKKQREDATKPCSVPVAKKACDNTNAPPLPPKPQPKSSGKGLAIISRFPNSKNLEEASGKNLVVSKDDNESKVSDASLRIVHDSSKIEPTKINVNKPNKPESKSAPAQSISEPQPSSSSVPPSSSKTDPDIQVNEISSSDTESSSCVPRTSSRTVPPLVPPPGAALKPTQRKSLSRELASLALDSPAPKLPARGRRDPGRQSSGVLAPRRRGRSIDSAATGRDNESDEENGGGAGSRSIGGPGAVQSHRSGAAVQTGTRALGPTKLDEVEAKCDALSNKLRMMERKVADRTDKLSQEVKDIKSKLDVATPTRVLRSRNGENGAQTPASGTKRKRIEQEKEGGKGIKRERTTTWSGLLGNKLEKSHQKSTTTRVTRKSTGALSLSGKGRRSLNILKK